MIKNDAVSREVNCKGNDRLQDISNPDRRVAREFGERLLSKTKQDYSILYYNDNIKNKICQSKTTEDIFNIIDEYYNYLLTEKKED